MAARLGYDAVEVMVGIDATSQDIGAGQAPVGLPRDPRLRGPRALPAHHPAGLGHRPVGQARDAAPRWPRASAPTWSSSTRRSAGSATTPRVRRGHRAARGADRHRVRGREHVSLAGLASRRDAGLRAALGPGRARTTPTPRSTSRTPPPPGTTPSSMARAARAPAAPHPPRPTAPGSAKDEHLIPGRGNQPVRRAARAARRAGVRRPRGPRDQHPQVRQPRAARGRPDGGAGVHPAATSRRHRAPRHAVRSEQHDCDAMADSLVEVEELRVVRGGRRGAVAGVSLHRRGRGRSPDC